MSERLTDAERTIRAIAESHPERYVPVDAQTLIDILSARTAALPAQVCTNCEGEEFACTACGVRSDTTWARGPDEWDALSALVKKRYDEAAALAARLDAVRALHVEPYPGAGWCAGCHDSAREERHPCGTLDALDAPTATELDGGGEG